MKKVLAALIAPPADSEAFGSHKMKADALYHKAGVSSSGGEIATF